MLDDTPPAAGGLHQQRTYYYHETLYRRMMVWLARSLFRGIAVMQSSGVDKLPDSGPVVLVANHMTNFDVFPMQFAISRPIFFMAKVELHRNPVMDALLRPMGSFPVERGSRDEWAIEHAVSLLQHGKVLGIFPEGKRNKGLGLRPAKTGAARLALAADCPIVPLAVDGTQRMFHRFPRRTRVRITIGTALFPQPGETALALTDRMMFSLAGLLPPKQRGVYSHHPPGF